MSGLDEILDTFERVIWKGKPSKKAHRLGALAYIPFGMFFLAFGLFMLALGESLIGFPVILIIFAGVLFIVPTLWLLRRYPNTEYMITDQRLIIKEGIGKDDIWFVKLDKIKKVIVKKGIVGKIVSTGSIYPITAEYPYAPKWRVTVGSSQGERGGMYRPITVYNDAEGRYEEVTEMELYTKTRNHPHLKYLKGADSVRKTLMEAISETREK